MGMPITVTIVDEKATAADSDAVFEYFTYVDEKFSTYKPTSEISRINKGELAPAEYSEDMKTIFTLSEETKQATNGYFDIRASDGSWDPSGLVKGWSIHNAAKILAERGCKNFCIEAGGDIQVAGTNAAGGPWRIGLRNPFQHQEIIKTVAVSTEGVATSGTYLRGQHIYNPHQRSEQLTDVVSISVIGPNIYEADRFATAAFAMGQQGISFIEQVPGFEGYQINHNGVATMTSGFENYVTNYA